MGEKVDAEQHDQDDLHPKPPSSARADPSNPSRPAAALIGTAV
jgi:hypothetical protein